MTDFEQHLTDAARWCGVDADDADLPRLARLLDRLENRSAPPVWRDDPGPAPPLPVPATADGPPVSEGDLRRAVDGALERASSAEAGGAYTWIGAEEAHSAVQGASSVRGRLAGFTLAVKDLMAVAGRPLTAGSRARADAPPEPRDAAVVAALRSAGAVVVGTTVCHEFAFGPSGVNDHAGTARNPRDEQRIAGGSSSGSALAVAEGSARIALGTDTGGSVRIPAALCGVVGYKPSLGTYPDDRVFPLSPSLDHVGILTSSVADVVAVHAALGHSAGAPTLPARVGVVAGDLDDAEVDVADAVHAARDRLASAGVEVVEVDWPDAEDVFVASTAIMFAEAAAVHRESLRHRASHYGGDVRARLLTGLAVPASTYLAARRRADDLRRRVAGALDGVDAVVGPTVPVVAPTVEAARDPGTAGTLVRHTRLANVAGVPAVSLPLPVGGLPVGLQVHAADDAGLLGVAGGVEHLLAG